MNSALTVKSSNAKTGPIAVSTTSALTCPATCPMAASCYAKAGYYTRLHWGAVTSGERGTPFEQFVAAVSKLRPGTMFRHNVAGDLWHDRETGRIDHSKILGLARATSHLKAAWTYTHHRLDAANRLSLEVARRMGFVVNASCEDAVTAVALVKEGIPAVAVVPSDFSGTVTVDGVRVVQCPATREGSAVTCATCGGANGIPLCAQASRPFVVAFPAHGVKAKLAPV